MKRVIALNHNISYYNDMMFSISVYYGIHYDEIETKNGYVMLFTIREKLEDLRTLEYFRDMLCVIFNTEPSNDYYIASEESREVSIYTILLAFVDYMRKNSNERHYKEKIRRFNEERKVDMTESMPVIHLLKNGNYSLTPIENYVSGYYVCERLVPEKLNENTKEQSGNRDKNNRATYRNFNWENLYESCSLYRSFCNGECFYDVEQIFLLARGMCGAEKGKQRFLDIMTDKQSENSYSDMNWKEILTAIIKGNVPLAPCEQCEYCDHCQHAENMLSTAKPQKFEVRELKREKYVSLEDVSADLNYAFQRAVNSQSQSIFIIKAQTGAGKTETYIRYMKNSQKPLLIAVPTHNLKNEILNKARITGIENICCTPDLNDYSLSDKLKNEIDNLYRIGAGEYVLKYLTGQLKTMKKTDSDYKQISDYLDSLKRAYRFDGHIITTHSRLIHMKQEILDSHEVIIDEDILRTVINTDSVSMEDLKFVGNKGVFDDAVQSRINYLCMERGYRKLDRLYIPKDDETLKKISSLKSDIYNLLSAEYVYITTNTIHYLTDNTLPHGKLIILSATASPELYQMFYSDRHFDFYECRKAKYKGKIIQHTDCSYSGYILEKNPERMSSLFKSTIDDIVITFKDIEKEFNTKYHFGNVEGLNLLSGKNLAVIGLPNKPDFVYLLYGMRAGLEFDKAPNMYVHRVENGSYTFSLNTFKDKVLQKIQMWMLSSQLEQAVGRARLLRNNCTVSVYAGFPVEQAEFYW